MGKTYSIFGAGAAGLYTAWRLLGGGSKPGEKVVLQSDDTLELYDWGQYAFTEEETGTRPAGARVCTWHYDNDETAAYLEVGGMRYSHWDGQPNSGGHRLVTTVISQLGMDDQTVVFNESDNPLYCLRAKNFYLTDITATNPAPYNIPNGGAAQSPDQGFTTIQNLTMTEQTATNMTRKDWCKFYQEGAIIADLGDASAYKKGDLVKDIGYWDLMYDQLGSEGYQYAADGNGYSSNVINWNTALAINSNNEFTPGTQYKTLSKGYSSMFNQLFKAIQSLSKETGVRFRYEPNTRLHSILEKEGKVHYTTATREFPDKADRRKTTDAAWMAMPRYAIELVAQATRYQHHDGLDVLNHKEVQLYLESAIMQPSYKVGFFFDRDWWSDTANPAPPFPAKLSVTSPAGPNTIGPSVTDMPIRQVVYFGNNAQPGYKKAPVYGLLASYDDEQFTSFWQEMELGPHKQRERPISANTQPLEGPKKVPVGMEKMLRAQLASLHFGPNSTYNDVPKPLEARYMDWSLPPFNAGYHAFAAHYDICDVQQKIRKPSQLILGTDANIFIVGETYSNDQAWVEGAYCTAESVLNDFFGVAPIISNADYPFICCTNC